MKRILLGTSLLLFVLLISGSQVHARRWLPGEPAAAAHPILGSKKTKALSIQLKEFRLKTDLRSFLKSQPVPVKATYLFQVKGAGSITLQWVMPGLRHGKILFQGKALSSKEVSKARLPKLWRYPYTCKLLGNINYMLELSSCTSPAVRTATLVFDKSGAYKLETEFKLRVHTHHGADVYRQKVFAYLFTPFQLWSMPEKLSLQAALPKNWVWKSNAALKSDGKGWLKATLPGKALEHWVLSAAPRSSIGWVRHAAPWVGMGLGMFLVLLLGWWRLNVVRGKSKGVRISLNLVVSIVAMMLPLLPFYFGLKWLASDLQWTYVSSVWKLSFDAARSFFLIISASSGLLLCWLTGLIRWVSENVERDQARSSMQTS
jgi:hypothetical protein